MDKLTGKPLNVRAIIPAAGNGSRLAKDGLDLPKVLHKIGGRELISFVLEEISFVKAEDTYVVTGCGRESVEAFLDSTGRGYRTVFQERQLGTGHAVAVCAPCFEDFDGTVLVTFGDMPFFRREVMELMCRLREESGAACVLMTAEDPALTDWARVIRSGDGRFLAIVEGRDCTPEQARTRELFAGVLVFDSKKLFEYLPKLDRNNAQGEYYLTAVPELMSRDGLTVLTVKTDDSDDLRGVNTPEDILACEEVLRKHRTKRITV